MNAYAGKNRRRNILSQPKTQLRIIFFFAFLAIVYAALNAYISKYAFGSFTLDVQNLALPPTAAHDVAVLAEEHEATLDMQLALFTLLSFCMLCLAGVLMSHRIGGPIYHLKKYMDGIGRGTESPRAIRFRKDDFFHDLAESFNRFQVQRGILKERAPDDAKKA